MSRIVDNGTKELINNSARCTSCDQLLYPRAIIVKSKLQLGRMPEKISELFCYSCGIVGDINISQAVFDLTISKVNETIN